MGSSWEVMSFALRAAGSRDQQQLAYNVVSQILLLLAPLCKFILLNRLLYAHLDEEY